MVLRDGLCNAPASFQFFLNNIFHDLLDKGVIIYIDDITVYSTQKEQHTKSVKEVLNRLRDNHLIVSVNKCEWAKPQITFLGFIIGSCHGGASTSWWPVAHFARLAEVLLRIRYDSKRNLSRTDVCSQKAD